MFLGKGVQRICGKFTGEHPCRKAISIKLQSNFIVITLQQWCSPVNLLHIFRTPFLKSTSGWLLLKVIVNQGFFGNSRYKLLEMSIKKSCKKLAILCNTLHSKNQKSTKYNIGYRRDVSLSISFCKKEEI